MVGNHKFDFPLPSECKAMVGREVLRIFFVVESAGIGMLWDRFFAREIDKWTEL